MNDIAYIAGTLLLFGGFIAAVWAFEKVSKWT